MSRVDNIKQLFEAVYESEKATFRVQELNIKKSVGNIGHGYRPNPDWIKNMKSITPSYDEPSQRCAYLLKYSMLHTAMVYDFLHDASRIYLVTCTISAKKALNLCSLGSGPGTDIVALLFFLRDHFYFKQCQANLVDQSIGWEGVFESVVSELSSSCYNVSEMVSKENFSFKYLKADLLNFRKSRDFDTIHNADIITMVKFISAAACKDTREMLKKIFKAMKHGALLLFIDNAGGRFCEMLEENAKFYGLKSVYKSEKYCKYEEPEFNIVKLGITSQYQSAVVAEMWMKESSSQDDGCEAHNDSDESDEIDCALAHSGYDEWGEIDCAVAHSDSDENNETDDSVAHSSYNEWGEVDYAEAHSVYEEWGETDYAVAHYDSDENDETDDSVAYCDSDESDETDDSVAYSDSDENDETDDSVAHCDSDENNETDSVAHSDSDENDETDDSVAHSGCDEWSEVDYAEAYSGYDEWGETEYAVAHSDSDEDDETDDSEAHSDYNEW